MSLRQRLERLGRRLLVRLLALLLGVHRRPVALPDPARILVIRLDERVGNLLLSVPLLDSLRARFPRARIELLASVKAASLLIGHPCLDELLPFRKKALCAADGPLAAPFRLRARRYDLALDAGNPTDPSATQVILTRLCGATHTVGVDHPDFGRLYSAPVPPPAAEAHEIDLRLALLAALPGAARSRRLFLGPLPAPPAEGPLAELHRQLGDEPFGLVNVGARLPEKTLSAEVYAALAAELARAGLVPVLTYGPREQALAEAAARGCPTARCAPPTTLVELAILISRARRVVTCDTGPMHLAVAVGTPTCGLFVATPPERYGHGAAPHRIVDARSRAPACWIDEVRAWLQPPLSDGPR